MKTVKIWFSRLALVGFGFLLALLILEAGLRLFGNPFGFRVKGDQIVLPVHRQYTIINRTNPKLDSVIVHTKNSLGFRGPEPPPDLENYLSVVAVGGSTTESFNISDGKTWVDVLTNDLAMNFDPLWVNNAGFVGHSTYGHMILVQDYLVQLRPKVIVFLVGANELGLTDLGEYDRSALVDRRTWKGVVRWGALHSEVLALGLNLTRYWQTRQLEYDRGYLDLAALPVLRLSDEEVEARLRPYQGEPLVAYQERLEKLIDMTRANGIEPVLMTQPALYGDVIDPTTGVDLGTIPFREGNGRSEWATLELYNDVTRQVAAAQNVFLIDLAHQMPKDSRYYRDVIHYTNEGSALLASLIYPPLCQFLASKFPEYQIQPCPSGSTIP
ncbi:MAG: SGNH/GDSL hydrolase family protein [Chloroflexi bacterium]|nr:MAG: SGNH/GDSL hydrolase family protein [Chloroflexota bacterium]